jgi:glycosyltransferase involved in cell wall biosynthesis
MTTSPVSHPGVTICVTAFNEEGNVRELAVTLGALLERYPEGLEVSIIDNGSTDATLSTLLALLAPLARASVCRIEPNRRYGGGMLAAIAQATTEYVALIPADGQYSVNGISRVLDTWYANWPHTHSLMVKGARVKRADPRLIGLLSRTYSGICRLVFGLPPLDVNGLPKVLPRDLFTEFGSRMPTDAVFDATLLYLHRRLGREIVEVPVTFEARRKGDSSWSSQIVRTCVNMVLSALRTRWAFRAVPRTSRPVNGGTP